jgi:hypothetical protein
VLTRYFLYLRCYHRVKKKIFNTNTMASHEFGGIFGLNDYELLQSLPATVQRRKDKLPRTPTSTAAPESTEIPYTSDDTYNDEPDTPTITRKQRSQPQSQPS